MIISQTGIWSSSDNQITEVRHSGRTRALTDFSRKHLSIRCTDGEALIIYSGIAQLRGQSTGDWLRRVVRNAQMTLDQMIELIRSQSDQHLAPLAGKARMPHVFRVGCWNIRGEPRLIIISNFEPGARVLKDRFLVKSWQVVNTAVRIIGAHLAISLADRSLLTRIQKEDIAPRSVRDYMKLLAAITYRAALHPQFGALISRTSLTAYLPAPDMAGREKASFAIQEIAAHELLEPYRFHLPPKESLGKRTRAPRIERGFDITELSDALMEIVAPSPPGAGAEALSAWYDNWSTKLSEELERRWNRKP
jgi:hypothetical protein